MRVLGAMQLQIEAFLLEDHREAKVFIDKKLSVIDHVKKDFQTDGWVHSLKTSSEYQRYQETGMHEAIAYFQLGLIFALEKTEDSRKRAIELFGRARIVSRLIGDENLIKAIETKIESMSMLIGNDKGEERGGFMAQLEEKRRSYEISIQARGESAWLTIKSGVCYGITLSVAKRSIEAERLAAKLAAISRQFHGPDHECTRQSEGLLKHCRERFVGYMFEQDRKFQPLSHDDDAKSFVVKGPIDEAERNVEEEQTFTVASDHIFPWLGCPVICHGLKNASHLNGKLGETRSHSRKDGINRYAVHFEDKSLKPALVKPSNLRIVIDLPDKE